jgi:hypothetical protein
VDPVPTSEGLQLNRNRSIKPRYAARIAAVIGAAVVAEAVLIRLGQTYGSTPDERAMRLIGDEIVPNPQVVTNHAITIDAPPDPV